MVQYRDMQFPKTPNKVHEEIREFLNETGREIIEEKEKEQNNQWILKVKQGVSKVKILHPTGKDYIYIIFEYEVDEVGQKLLIDTYSGTNNVVDFNYDLVYAITSPHVSISFRRLSTPRSDYIYMGFDIAAKVFPFEESYSIQYLEDAIQNVINAGRLGIYFFAVRLKSYREAIKLLEMLDSSFDGMFI